MLELFEVVSEIFAITRLIMDLYQSYTIFFRHGCDHWAITYVDFFLVYSQVRILHWPLTYFEWSFGEVDLIDVDYEAALQFGLFYVLNQILAVLNKFKSRRKWHDFL